MEFDFLAESRCEKVPSLWSWLIFLLEFKGIETGAFTDKWLSTYVHTNFTGHPGTAMDGIRCIFHHPRASEEQMAFKAIMRQGELLCSPVPHSQCVPP